MKIFKNETSSTVHFMSFNEPHGSNQFHAVSSDPGNGPKPVNELEYEEDDHICLKCDPGLNFVIDTAEGVSATLKQVNTGHPQHSGKVLIVFETAYAAAASSGGNSSKTIDITIRQPDTIFP